MLIQNFRLFTALVFISISAFLAAKWTQAHFQKKKWKDGLSMQIFIATLGCGGAQDSQGVSNKVSSEYFLIVSAGF